MNSADSLELATVRSPLDSAQILEHSRKSEKSREELGFSRGRQPSRTAALPDCSPSCRIPAKGESGNGYIMIVINRLLHHLLSLASRLPNLAEREDMY